MAAGGRHFLQIPGPSPVPDRISRAIDALVIDHRGPDFSDLGLSVLSGMQRIFKTQSPVVIYSGTGAWEATLNVLKKLATKCYFTKLVSLRPSMETNGRPI